MFSIVVLVLFFFSGACNAQSQACNGCTVVSQLDAIQSLQGTIDSDIDAIADDIFIMNSKLDRIGSEIEVALSEADAAQAGSIDLSAIDQSLFTISSKLDIPEPTLASITDECLCLLSPCQGCPITATDIGSTGTTIAQSGSYYLATYVNANTGSATAITIDADNVTLDMNNNTIRRSSDGNTIEITANHSNIVIKNGFIRNNTGGLRGILVKEGCSNITFEDMVVIGTGSTNDGVEFEQNCSDIIINECTFSRSGTHGLLFNDASGTACSRIIITESNFNENGGSGIKMNNCTNVSANWLALSLNAQHGVEANTVSNFSFTNCHVTENSGDGFYLNASTKGQLKDNVVQNNVGVSSTGIELVSTASVAIIANLSASNDTGLHADSNSLDNAVEDNIFIMNTTVNVDNDAANMYVGNFALNTNAATQNYTGAVTSFFNANTILTTGQTTAFAATPQHARWYNVSFSTT